MTKKCRPGGQHRHDDHIRRYIRIEGDFSDDEAEGDGGGPGPRTHTRY